MEYVQCPLRCGWQTVDRSHLGRLVVVDADSGDEHLPGRLRTVDAVQHVQDEVLGHLAERHREQLLRLVAGMEGGRGEPVLVGITQQVATDAIRGAEDVVLSTLVPRMRAQLAQRLADQHLRPLDPWPALELQRFAWADRDHYSATMLDPDSTAPPGMRPVRDGERTDLFQLELRTLAVQDGRPRLEL